MQTLTIKIPPALEQDIARASARQHLSKSELVRRALTAYLRHGDCAHPAPASALDRAGDLVGCFSGGPADLASNPAHMADFGKV